MTARDLDLHRVILYGSHILLFRCTVHSMIDGEANNLVVMNSKSSYCAVVECLVYDCDKNDLVSIHDSSSGPVGSHHWVVDNIMIANAGSEQGFDFASEAENFGHSAFDVKLINNSIQCRGLAGLSRYNGSSSGGITSGHTTEYVWLLSNIVTGGCTSYGANLAGYNQAFSGNIVYDTASAHNVMINMGTKRGDSIMTHNTFLQSITGRNPVAIEDAASGNRDDVHIHFSHNVVGLKTNEGKLMQVVIPPPPNTIETFDHNFYLDLQDGASGLEIVNNLPLTAWQAESSLDMNSGDGAVPGVSVPDALTWADPRNWTRTTFLAHFTPDPSWDRCAGADTPGAFDCDGNHLGGLMAPFTDYAENDGFGWLGPAIIQERYPLPNTQTSTAPSSSDDLLPVDAATRGSSYSLHLLLSIPPLLNYLWLSGHDGKITMCCR
jgi:hypothetical protein